MEERDETTYTEKTIRGINWEIGNKHKVYNIGKNVDHVVTENAVKVMQNNCDHSLVLLLNASGNRTAHYCLSCGKVVYTLNDVHSKRKPFPYGIALNFSRNSMTNSLDVDGSDVVKAMERLIGDSADSKTDLSIPEFISTIPSELYSSPEAIRGVLKEKAITKE